jgi:hypothetical protein
MKHVFGVASHLVFYLCRRIIELDSINPDDCIFFFMRNYHCPEKYNSQFVHQIHFEEHSDVENGRVFAGVQIFQTNKNIKAFDELVDSYIKGQDFYWYSQICNNDYCSLFVTKPNCRGYYVLEDGLGSYRNYNPQTFTGWKYPLYRFVLKPIWNRCFEVKNHFITTDHPKFKGCIATTEYCFPLHQQYLRCVGLPFEEVKLDFEPDAVVSIDPLYLWIEESHEPLVYKRVADFIKHKKYKCLAYKFHPYFFSKNNVNHKKRYEKLIQEYLGMDVLEIDPSIGLENVLMTYKPDFYTDNSSVAIYGHAMGVTCYTYMPILREYTNAYNNVPLIEDFCKPVN